MRHQYAGYLPSDFDNYDCLKVSKVVYFILIFVLRGYLVWIMSVTNMRDKIGVMQWVYPQPKLFYLSLLSGSLGLFVLLVLSLRRPNAKSWVRKSWRKLRVILIISLAFDLTINSIGYFYWQLQSSTWLITNIVVVLAFCFYLLTNKRLKINIAEFPEEVPK
ncbi:DUF2919 family protein [Colwelliaceae bacterium 6441]